MHKRESFSQMMTCEFLSLINHLINDVNLHFKENEIKTDKETVMQTSSDNCTVKKKCIHVLFVSGTITNETMY